MCFRYTCEYAFGCDISEGRIHINQIVSLFSSLQKCSLTCFLCELIIAKHGAVMCKKCKVAGKIIKKGHCKSSQTSIFKYHLDIYCTISLYQSALSIFNKDSIEMKQISL